MPKKSKPIKRSRDSAALNNRQAEAVALPASANALILAGAGSGKTLVLTHRYKKLLEEDRYRPEEILSATFTNKAANEMRRRIHAVTGARYTLPWIGTFHGLANRILRQHHGLAGLRRNYTIIDRSEQVAVLRRLYKEHFAAETDKENLGKTADVICRFKERAVRAAEVEDHVSSLDRSYFYLRRYAEIYQIYEEHCRAESMVDFSELILCFYEMLQRNHPELEYIQKGLRTVLVDEFQDTNDLQFKLVCKLCENGQSVFAVGDDDQLIYSWRGANPENLKKLTRHFKDVEVVRLEQNYRSSQGILDVANSLIENNENRMPKKLWSERPTDSNILLHASPDEHVEANLVRQTVARWHKEEKVPLNEIAILYRKSFLARNLENALGAGKIPYDIHGGVRFTDREEVRHALAWLAVCLDPDDDYASQRSINVPTRGIGNATIKRIRAYSKENGTSFFRAIEILRDHESMPARAREALGVYLDLVAELSQWRHLHPRQLLERIYEVTGLFEYYQAKSSKDVEFSRQENLVELLNAADEFVEGRERAHQEFGGSEALGAGLGHGGNGAGLGGNGASQGGNGASLGHGGNGAGKGGNGESRPVMTSAKGGNGASHGGNGANKGGNGASLGHGGNGAGKGGNGTSKGGNGSEAPVQVSAKDGKGANKGGNGASLGHGGNGASKDGNGESRPVKTSAKSGNGALFKSSSAEGDGGGIQSADAPLHDYSAVTLEFVANTALDSVGPEQAKENVREAVQLMTIHAAKGLEFRCVILCGLEEGVLPHIGNVNYADQEDNEEERRLCYVAITRARDHLMLSSVRNRNIRGKYNYSEPSRFIHEMFVHDPERLEGQRQA